MAKQATKMTVIDDADLVPATKKPKIDLKTMTHEQRVRYFQKKGKSCNGAMGTSSEWGHEKIVRLVNDAKKWKIVLGETLTKRAETPA